MDGASAGSERIVPLSRLFSAQPPTDPVAPPQPDPASVLEEERTRVLQAARAQGLAEGRKQAESEIPQHRVKVEQEVRASLAEAQARTERLNEQLAQLVRGLSAASAASETCAAEAFVEIVHAAVLRIIGASAADAPLIRRVCEQALAESTQRPVVLHVHPGDAPLVAPLADDTGVEVRADDRVAPGQCRLRTHKGDYDTSLEERLDAFARALLVGWRKAGHA